MYSITQIASIIPSYHRGTGGLLFEKHQQLLTAFTEGLLNECPTQNSPARQLEIKTGQPEYIASENSLITKNTLKKRTANSSMAVCGSFIFRQHPP